MTGSSFGGLFACNHGCTLPFTLLCLWCARSLRLFDAERESIKVMDSAARVLNSSQFSLLSKTTQKEGDRKSGGERGHAGKVMSQTTMLFQTCVFVRGDTPLLLWLSRSPTLPFFHFAECAASKYPSSCFFQIKLSIVVSLHTRAHLLSVLTAWSGLQCHGDCDGISLARVQADCTLFSGLSIYFWAHGRRELKYPHATGVIWGYECGHQGPSLPRSCEGSTGTREALRCLPSSSSFVLTLWGARGLVLIHDNTHTQTHLLLFTGRAGISLHPLACMSTMRTHTHTHIQSQVDRGLYWTAPCPSPTASAQRLSSSFPPHAALCIYITPLLIDHWQAHSYPFCLLWVCMLCIFACAATERLLFQPLKFKKKKNPLFEMCLSQKAASSEWQRSEWRSAHPLTSYGEKKTRPACRFESLKFHVQTVRIGGQICVHHIWCSPRAVVSAAAFQQEGPWWRGEKSICGVSMLSPSVCWFPAGAPVSPSGEFYSQSLRLGHWLRIRSWGWISLRC